MIPNRLHWIFAFVVLIAAHIATPAFAETKPSPQAEVRPAPTADEIGTWITQLNDDRYLARERATRQLLDAGASALDPLLATADSDRPEPADRSVWILRRLSTAKDQSLKRQALEHLANLKKRPQVAAAARGELADIEHKEALEAIEQLGGHYVEGEFMMPAGVTGRVGRLVLDERWHGGDAGLAHLRRLAGLRHLIIIGTDISVEGLKQLEHCDSLQELWLYGTKVSPEDLPKVRKMLREQIVIDYRRGALLGVGRTAGSDTVSPAVVDSVTEGGAAAAAGIQRNDIIQKFNGEAIANFKALTQKIGDHHPGDEVTLGILRNGQPMEFKVKLGQWKTID